MKEKSEDFLEAPLFRGATKPVMFIGVPINALVLAVLPCLILMILVWGQLGLKALVFLFPAALAIPIMRQITKQDDQYLNMWFLQLREFNWLRKNKLNSISVIPPRAFRHSKFIND
ncbi:VirB3 family type IV secretion system protein [Suttonella ornithocola]|uniref:Type IV secretory pathway, VirB3-like protein n=1 Tax=Suttonella ornithocola TaxID=279832 RepID=A0A380MV65_9GAMM|nr:VirB3 family type IV secretion system protein [Suttonella ornithocola]SUO96188.1 Type IV secretory pathway, VirB3-like protein [Suttonella ornithocola]